jgi:hypothetical protein
LLITTFLQIVPKHSAILSAYPNKSIHANHMQMTKFGSSQDPGYVSVSSQLWLWVDAIEKVQAEASAQAGPQVTAEEVRETRNRRFGTIQDIVQQQNSYGEVRNRDGIVVQGNQRAERDMTIGK